jgi:hypothetical protein
MVLLGTIRASGHMIMIMIMAKCSGVSCSYSMFCSCVWLQIDFCVYLKSSKIECSLTVLSSSTTQMLYTVQFWMIQLSRFTVGTWCVKIWYMSHATMATWWKLKNVTICFGFLLRDRMSSSSKFCPGLPKFWPCHGPLGELPKWKFWQACHCHSHGGVMNHSKLYSILSQGIYVSLLLTLSHSYHICLWPYLFILLPSSYLYPHSFVLDLSMIYEFYILSLSNFHIWVLAAACWGIYRITHYQ